MQNLGCVMLIARKNDLNLLMPILWLQNCVFTLTDILMVLINFIWIWGQLCCKVLCKYCLSYFHEYVLHLYKDTVGFRFMLRNIFTTWRAS